MKLTNTLFLLLFSAGIFAQKFNPDVISSRLAKQLDSTDGYHHISILLRDRVDVEKMDETFYQQNASLEERVFTLITSLRAKAASSQRELLNFLRTSKAVDQTSINSFWITNLIFIKAKKEAIAQISFRDDIEWIDINARLELTAHEDVEIASPPQPEGIEPGLAVINAPAMWALGYTGYGRVTFVNDTGVDPGHPALKLKYRGHYVESQQAWFQYNSSNILPYDCSDHGTHVLGTMVGLDRNTNDTIGVAYNSLWIGAPILCGIGTSDNIAALQWSLDPDSDPGTIIDMPDVINNSWYDPSLTDPDCASIYVSVFDALEASGIAVIFSAGNEGPLPETITPPHNINTNLVNSFTVGALDGYSDSLDIADFSSIGPSLCGGTGSLLIKPEVSAPGVNVRSSIPNGGYDIKSGTSMAAPHVAGAILLLKEAFPNLTGAELKLALYHSCIDLGEPGEDNTYGMGLIDVFAAYNHLIGLGNIPVEPHVTHDLILIDAIAPVYICDSILNTSIIVENASAVPVNSFEIYYEISGAGNNSGVFPWSGVLTPGEKITIELPDVAVASGIHTFHIEIRQPNGVADERPLNNAFRQWLIRPEEVPFSAEVDQINDHATCEGASALLRADFSGDGTIEWYDSLMAGNLLGTGEELFVQQLDSSTTFFADVRVNSSVGIANPDPDNLEFTAEVGNGIVFDSYYPFVLKSVTIYPKNLGVVIISLKRRSGTGIASKNLFLTHVGEQVVELDMQVPVNLDLVLMISDGVPLKHNTEGISYPYSADAVMSIKSSTDEDDPEGYYFYFYDWKIEYSRLCGRIPVEVEVEPTDVAPLAAFDSSADSIDLEVSGAVSFTNTSTGAVQWQWNFGDGNFSDLENPEHIYSAAGTYVVSLTVLNADDCSNTAIDTIVVYGMIVDTKEPKLSDDQILVFPVPADDLLNIRFGLQNQQIIGIRLFDLLGREVLFFGKKSYFKDTEAFSLSGLSEGVYFIVFESENQRIVRKIVKAKD